MEMPIEDTRYADFVQPIRRAAVTTARANYRLLFLAKYIIQLLEKEGIRAILLKGAATASYYPIPEMRKSGDVDILIPQEKDFERAVELLDEVKFVKCVSQSALHHIELKNQEGICVELHRILAEPFESGKMNRYLESLLSEFDEHVQKNDSWGVTFYQPADAYHAFYLIVHMLQHFLRAGFGLKFLCDWTVFWNLGLAAENVSFLLGESDLQQLAEDFMEEVFVSGEFGHGTQERMVAMRGTGLAAYVREFHHQMHLNYPSAGKMFLLWPFLWVMTLARFIKNNRTVRKVKGLDILKEARRRRSGING